MSTQRLLISDNNINFNMSLKKFFEERGFEVFVTSDGQEAFKIIVSQKPQIALLEMMLPKLNALQVLTKHKPLVTDGHSSTKIIVISNQTNVDNIRECMRLGATDFLLKPIELEEIVPRIIFHLQPPRKSKEVINENEGANLFLHLTELLLKQSSISDSLDETLFKISQITAMSLKSIRCSIIQCAPHRRGIVRASSDDSNNRPWMLDLRKYPEILSVINTGKTVAIDNLDSDPTMAEIKKYFANIKFNSMIVTPIFTAREDFFGVLTIRMPPNREPISEQEIRFSQIVAQIIGVTLRMYPQSALSDIAS